MKISARNWIVTSALLAAAGLGFAGLSGGGGSEVQAAAPKVGFEAKTGVTGTHGQRRESGPPSTGPAPMTGPASAYNPLRPSDPPTWGDNHRANTDTQSPNLAQQEPSIAINPLNTLNVVAAAKDERAGSNTKKVWIYTSTDGGVTWLNQIFPLIAPISPYSSDPVVKFSDDGICYVVALPYGGGTAGIQVSASTDGGITFGAATAVTTNGSADKEWMWIDNFPSSPYYHRMYVGWMDFNPGFTVTYSSDRGQTWVQTNIHQSAYQFPMPIVYPNGDVQVIFQGGSGIQSIRSTNGGVNWSSAQPLATAFDPNCPPDNAGCSIWRLNLIPVIAVNPNNGNAVTVWADGSGGTATIKSSRSTNNGVTWSAPVTLAPPGVANTYQVEPWVEADEQGWYHAIWYDDRENPNTSIFNIYYSQSTDDGQTWSNAVRISTATSDLRIGIPSSYARAAGDYINVTASHGNVYGTWTDTRAGNGEDIYVVRGTFSGGGTPTPTFTGTPPTATRTRTPTNTPSPTPTLCGSYSYATATATVEPGTIDAGNHCDDCTSQITLPFAWSLYNSSYTTANVSSNGSLQFASNVSPFTNGCLPDAQHSYTIFGYWDDLRTDSSGSGIYTSVTGVAPNRTINVEWRATTFSGGAPVNFEIRLYEGQGRFDIVYGANPGGGSATVGVQGTGSAYTQYECNTGGITSGLALIWTAPPCGTPGVTNTPTSTSTVPPVITNTPTATATPCTISFTDVHPSDWFYEYVRYLYCRGAISGYADGTFRPYNNTTRGQLSKIVVLGFQLPINTAGGPHFTDVAVGSTFYDYVETAYNATLISGYADGTFRPNNNVTRGQLTKIVVQAGVLVNGWTLLNPSTPTFTDVPPGSTFYQYIETAYCHEIISGYADGTFRPGNDATRAQIAKIASLAIQNTGVCAP